MAKLSSKSPTGTSWGGHEIKATPNQLIESLGEPQYGYNDGKDKSNFDWICETESGHVFTIYDWKEYVPLKMDSEYSFHVGSNSTSVASKAVQEVYQLLKNKVTEKVG
jgi:hypothetical protein